MCIPFFLSSPLFITAGAQARYFRFLCHSTFASHRSTSRLYNLSVLTEGSNACRLFFFFHPKNIGCSMGVSRLGCTEFLTRMPYWALRLLPYESYWFVSAKKPSRIAVVFVSLYYLFRPLQLSIRCFSLSSQKCCCCFFLLCSSVFALFLLLHLPALDLHTRCS